MCVPEVQQQLNQIPGYDVLFGHETYVMMPSLQIGSNRARNRVRKCRSVQPINQTQKPFGFEECRARIHQANRQTPKKPVAKRGLTSRVLIKGTEYKETAQQQREILRESTSYHILPQFVNENRSENAESSKNHKRHQILRPNDAPEKFAQRNSYPIAPHSVLGTSKKTLRWLSPQRRSCKDCHNASLSFDWKIAMEHKIGTFFLQTLLLGNQEYGGQVRMSTIH